MPDERSSGFFFDVQRWRGSKSVQRMSFSERGVYLEMMCEQWEKRSLPDDANAVADQLAMTTAQVDEVLAAWETVRRKFVAADKGPSRIYNVSLERVRRAQRDNRRRHQEAGQRGGKRAARNRQSTRELEASGATAMLSSAIATPSDAVALPTDKTRQEETRLDLTRSDQTREVAAPATRPVDARSKRPIFAGQKVTVFEWMLDECMRTLHPHEMDFDLHDWFFQLDAAAVRDGVIVPKKDGGEWLQAQLVAEAQRRGLPLQFARVPSERFGKQTTRLAAAVANIRAEAKR